jgi:hypothetical protein
VFSPQAEEENGKQRKLHLKSFQTDSQGLSSPNITRMITQRRRQRGRVLGMRGKIKAYKLLVGKSEEKRLPGRHTPG